MQQTLVGALLRAFISLWRCSIPPLTMPVLELPRLAQVRLSLRFMRSSRHSMSLSPEEELMDRELVDSLLVEDGHGSHLRSEIRLTRLRSEFEVVSGLWQTNVFGRFELVLPTGETVHANDKNNTDLFFGLKVFRHLYHSSFITEGSSPGGRKQFRCSDEH
jgi:hypothetical protein